MTEARFAQKITGHARVGRSQNFWINMQFYFSRLQRSHSEHYAVKALLNNQQTSTFQNSKIFVFLSRSHTLVFSRWALPCNMWWDNLQWLQSHALFLADPTVVKKCANLWLTIFESFRVKVAQKFFQLWTQNLVRSSFASLAPYNSNFSAPSMVELSFWLHNHYHTKKHVT